MSWQISETVSYSFGGIYENGRRRILVLVRQSLVAQGFYPLEFSVSGLFGGVVLATAHFVVGG